ncbi:hypothetical protein HAX54_008651, partial [Datura stramonium]|nr:hypothetical protein [Datura stramonium]
VFHLRVTGSSPVSIHGPPINLLCCLVNSKPNRRWHWQSTGCCSASRRFAGVPAVSRRFAGVFWWSASFHLYLILFTQFHAPFLQ